MVLKRALAFFRGMVRLRQEHPLVFVAGVHRILT
jgi:hypothetical protein